jgi:hypothetical protein
MITPSARPTLSRRQREKVQSIAPVSLVDSGEKNQHIKIFIQSRRGEKGRWGENRSCCVGRLIGGLKVLLLANFIGITDERERRSN